MRTKRTYFFPFILSIYPVLSLLVTNISQVELLDALRALVVSILFTGFVYVLVYVVFRDSLRTAIFTSLVLILFFSYGHLYSLIEDRTLLGFNIGRHRYLLATWLLILIFVAHGLLRRPPYLQKLGTALNIFSIVLIVMPVIQIVANTVRLSSLNGNGSSPIAEDNWQTPISIQSDQMSNSSELPDIYYFILDMYTRGDVFLKELDFDNSYFLDRLTAMGFYVAECSQSNYGSTILSLGSSLNLDYFQNLIDDSVDLKTSPYSFGKLVKYNRVRKIFEDLDYTIIAFESGFSPTAWREADLFMSPDNSIRMRVFGGLNPFETMFIRTTFGIFLYEYINKLPYSLQVNLQDYPYIQHRERILFTLDELENIIDFPGPKFVFAHVLAPHNPFVFDANGEFIRRDTPFTLNMDPESDTWQEFIPGYLGEVRYLNQRIEVIVANILDHTETPAIIIIQGDHGIPRFADPGDDVSIINTYYLPDRPAYSLYAEISPVNSFRLILDSYFGYELGLLEDVSYYSPQHEVPLDFEIVPSNTGTCQDSAP